MNKPLCRLRVLALSLTLPGLLWACGPKDVGTGTSAEATGTSPGVSVEDGLRYPVYGSDNTQRMLYWQNRPDVRPHAGLACAAIPPYAGAGRGRKP